MKNENLTILITGPIEKFSDSQINLFNEVISGGGEVVVSTWVSSVNFLPTELPSGVKVLTSIDWVSPVGYKINDKIKNINFDKQVHLIKRGLEEVKTDYTLRLRSDISIDLDAILKRSKIMDSGLIITTDVSSVNPNMIGSSKLALHPCDWLFASQTAVLKNLISECDFYVELVKRNIKLDSPYAVEDRIYFSTGAAEQYFGASLAGIKLRSSFFDTTNDGCKLISPISNGFYVVESASLKLASMKQKLRFKYPFRIKEADNYKYRRIPIEFSFFVEFVVHKLRCLLKTN